MDPGRKPWRNSTVKLVGGRGLRYGVLMGYGSSARLMAVALLMMGCDGRDHHRPQLAGEGARFWPEGQRYRLRLNGAEGAAPAGSRWVSPAFGGSPLAGLCRPAIIIKADDLGGPLNRRVARFIELVDELGAVAALGIITSRLADDPQTLQTYRELNRRGFELWFHGHRHDWSLPTAEFAGVGVATQQAAFRTGIDLARDRLGVAFHTFGAPGNAIDENTVTAIEAFPQLQVWLFGRPGSHAMVLPRLLELEKDVGVVREPSAFFADLDRALATEAPVITLQVHPNGFDETSISRLREILVGIQQRDLRFTTPHDWWCWQRDQGKIELTRLSDGSYELDLTAATCGLRLRRGVGS